MKWYKRLLKLLYPKPVLLIFLVLVSAAGLITVFTRGLEKTVPAYVLYFVSAYTAAAVVPISVRLFVKGKRFLHEKPLIHRYITELDFKAEVSLCMSFAVTFVYCVYKAAAGIYYASAWFGSMAFYYLVLGVVRFLLLRQIRSGENSMEKLSRQYRFCGFLLLVLTVALSAVSIHAIYGGEALRYPGYMIYAAAGFTFYNFAMAVFNVARYRKIKNPIYTASKLFSLASALVSVFFLQTSMFAVFGDGGEWQRHMNIWLGTVIYLFIFGMAVFMIVTGHCAVKRSAL